MGRYYKEIIACGLDKKIHFQQLTAFIGKDIREPKDFLLEHNVSMEAEDVHILLNGLELLKLPKYSG